MLTRRDRAVIGGLLLALVLLAAASAWPSVGPTAGTPEVSSPSPAAVRPYREGILGRPTSVSPFGARTAADRALVALVFSGLVRLGPGETFVPDLAERWTVDPTGAIYTFTLRADAVWHDGEPVTSDDVAFTIAALQDQEYDGPGAASWRDVTVSTLDARTVQFVLANPIGGFLVLATQPIAPAHLLDGIPPVDLPTNPFGQRPVGSGPYRLLDWSAGGAQLVVAGVEPAIPDGTAVSPPIDSLASPSATPPPDRPLPYIPAIDIRFSTDPAELMSDFQSGRLDAVSGLPPADAAELGAAPGARLLRYPRSTLTALLFDQRASRPEFADARTRLALLTAIDRDAIVATELSGLATRADALIPPTSWAYDSTADPEVKHDASAAADLLKDAGWTDLKSGGWAAPGSEEAYHLELLSPDATSNPAVAAVATAVAADWRELGLDVDVVGLPPAELVDGRLRTGDFAAAIIDVGVGLDPDLYPLLASSQTISGGSNVSGIQDPTLDTKLEAARRPGTDEARMTAYADLQTYLATKTFIGPLAWRDEVVVASEGVTGQAVRRLGEGADRFYDVLTWRLAGDR